MCGHNTGQIIVSQMFIVYTIKISVIFEAVPSKNNVIMKYDFM